MFSCKSLYALDKRNPAKCKFLDFRLLARKLTKFLMSFFKPQVSFLSWRIILLKFSSWNIIRFGQTAYQSIIFQTFECSNQSSSNSSCHFSQGHQVRVYISFASQFSVMKDNSSVFFTTNLINFGQKEPI